MIINSVIVGGSTGKKYVEGTATYTYGDFKEFINAEGNTSNGGYVVVKYNFGFIPSLIIITYAYDNTTEYTTIYNKEGWTTDARTVIKLPNGYNRLTGNAKVSATGFTLPFDYYNGDAVVNWVAYE